MIFLIVDAVLLPIDDLVLVGSASEADSVRSLASMINEARTPGPRVHVLAGGTSVGQLMAILSHARVVVGSDSAALHMAVGLGRPLVGLFGPTDPEEVGPYGCREWVLRDPAAKGAGHDYRSGRAPAPSMLALTVEQVSRALVSRLEGS